MRKTKEHQIYELFNNTFKDITLCLGGIFLTYKAKDKLIWEIANSVEDLYYRSINKLEAILGTGIIVDLENNRKNLHPHPAIEELLKVIGFKPGARRCK